jgi:hypothetical protein
MLGDGRPHWVLLAPLVCTPLADIHILLNDHEIMK